MVSASLTHCETFFGHKNQRLSSWSHENLPLGIEAGV